LLADKGSANDKKITKLEENLALLDRSLIVSEAKRHELEETLARTREDNIQWAKMAGQAQAQVEVLDDKIAELEAELRAEERLYNACDAENDSLRTINSNQSLRIAELEEENKALVDDYDETLEHNNRLINKVDELEKGVALACQANKGYSLLNDRLTEENAELKEQWNNHRCCFYGSGMSETEVRQRCDEAIRTTATRCAEIADNLDACQGDCFGYSVIADEIRKEFL
jgi:chromosome segregation ATPase